MDKKTMTILLIAAASIFVLWYLTKDKTVANTEPTGGTTAAPAAPISTSGATTTNDATVTAGKNSQTLTETSATTGSPSNTLDAAIYAWFNGLSAGNKAQAYKMYPSMTDSEKASLYDIIINEWQNGGPATTTRVNFWNNWRIKYHILDGTYS